MNKSLEIKKIDTAKNNIPQTEEMKEQILLPFPFSLIISGRSGSGKTNLLMNLLTRKNMYGGYFQYILVFSPTSPFDDLYKNLKIPKDNLKPKFSSEDLEKILEARQKQIKKHGIKKVAEESRLLIIFDDTIADQDFLRSREALQLFTLLRHYLISVILLTQTYNKVPKPLRNNANGVMIFPSNRSEIEILKDELCPPALLKKEFEKLIEYATSDKHSFLYINNKADLQHRYKKNLDEDIDINKFKQDNKDIHVDFHKVVEHVQKEPVRVNQMEEYYKKEEERIRNEYLKMNNYLNYNVTGATNPFNSTNNTNATNFTNPFNATNYTNPPNISNITNSTLP